MDRPYVSLKYERTFPYPVDAAYAWLTDYQDDDPQRAGTLVRRRDVVRRSDREVEVRGHLDILGRDYEGTGLIRLYPEEKRWVAIIGRGGWEFHYQLTPHGASGSRLTIDYRMGSRRWTRRLQYRLAKPFVRRHINRMWDGFDAAMRRELGPPTPLSPDAR